MTCDPIARLWPASFKGVPFWVDKDADRGSRRIVIHEFPMRDDPFLEDLGEGARHYPVGAYVANGGLVDVEAAAVMAAVLSKGPGLLVLPTHGPIMARGLKAERDRSKDRAGYIHFSLEFVREGVDKPLLSAVNLANKVIASVDQVVLALAASFATRLATRGQPDHVIDAARGAIVDVAAAFESVRSATPVEPEASADVRDALEELVEVAPDLVTRMAAPDGESVERVFELARDLGEALPADITMREFALLVEDLAPPPAPPAGATPSVIAAAVNGAVVRELGRLAALAAWAEALSRRPFSARPEAIEARAEAAERFDAELSSMAGADNAALFVAVQDLRNAVVEYLSRAILDLAPVLTVEANLPMPSLWWAWRLYADPMRATELVARNRVPHPSFMPTRFEALAR